MKNAHKAEKQENANKAEKAESMKSPAAKERVVKESTKLNKEEDFNEKPEKNISQKTSVRTNRNVAESSKKATLKTQGSVNSLNTSINNEAKEKKINDQQAQNLLKNTGMLEAYKCKFYQ